MFLHIQTSVTDVQPNSDTSPYGVSEYSLIIHSNFVNSDKDVSKVERESPFQKHVEMCTSVNLKNEAHH